MDWEREELARGALERADMGLPVDAEVLAHRLEFELYDTRPGCEGYLVADRIYVDPTIRKERWHFAIAHEIGHALQRAAGLRDTETGANYIGSALLLPRDDFERDLRRLGWDLLALRARHRWASFEAVARRIVALRDARAYIFDKPLRGQAPPVVRSAPWGFRPTHEERLAAREAVLCGAPVEIRAGLTGWPVLQDDWHRAITIRAL